uniref:PNPLA domain-containing protein n=1 Tax=viral metagenome TaxID=1070528 RepID=A0A6C0EQK5_9ZZZZ
MSLPFRKLGLNGGGIKGILHIGALRELAKHQPLNFPDGIYGCSVGSIIATYLSFGLPVDDKLIEMSKRYISMDRVTPKLTFNNISSALSHKGVFTMDMFEGTMIEMFLEFGINLKDMKIGDAPQPLYIIASNITKGVPTIFTKDVPILDALKCSCCLPGIFKPQVLYNQLYVDGGVFVPCISWIESDALVLSLTKQKVTRMTPQNITEVSPLNFMKDIYAMAVNHFMERHNTDLTVRLSYPKLTSDSDLGDFDIDDILLKSEISLRRFLISKSLFQELPEVLNTGSTSHLV